MTGDPDRRQHMRPSGAFRVALTFDVEHPDRPTVPGVTQRLLLALEEAHAKATMFIQGRWAEAYPNVARDISEAGHVVGNHSFYHARMPLFTDDGFVTDVRGAEAAITQACGVSPAPWFRCPFGAGQDDPALIARLRSVGYRNVGWDVDTADWGGGGAQELEEFVVRETLRVGDGAVVLMHGWPSRTADALPSILSRLGDEGATFLAVDALPAEDLPAGFPATSSGAAPE